MRAVRFDQYGDTSVLHLEEVDKPVPGLRQVLVRVVSAATNVLDMALREGAMGEVFPGPLPSGQGFDLAGTIVEIGSGVTEYTVGDQILGWAPRRAQAEFVAVDVDETAPKPPSVDWAVAASIPTVGATAYAAVQAVDPKPGETVVVSAAAGGVGALVAQLSVRRGATVIGTASERNFDFLRSVGVVPVAHGVGLEGRITAAAPAGVQAYLDNFGHGNVDLALRLGVRPDRVNTVIDFGAAATHGVHTAGQAEGNNAGVFTELASLVASGHLTLPIQSRYPMSQVRQAYDELAQRHSRGKIVLDVDEPSS
jgi:NADPH:quinone reductase-like Zn-dependent oxidoreductase